MLTQAVLRKLNLEECTPAVTPPSSPDDSAEESVKPRGASSRDGTSVEPCYKDVYDTLAIDVLSKKLYKMVVDLDSVLADILAAYRADMTVYYSNGLILPHELQTVAPPPPPASVKERIEHFFTFVSRQLVAPNKVTVRLVLGDLPRFCPVASWKSVKGRAAGEEEKYCSSGAAGWWGSTPFSREGRLWCPHTAAEGDPREGEAVSHAGHVCPFPLCPCMSDYAVWYDMYHHAQAVVEQSPSTCILVIAPGVAALSSAVALIRQLRQESHVQWLASAGRAKPGPPIAGGVPPLCLCSSNPDALFISAPMCSVVVDLYPWSLCHGTTLPTTRHPYFFSVAPVTTTLRVTHPQAVAAMLGLRGASLLPALHSVLATVTRQFPATHARVTSAEAADACLDGMVALVNRYNGVLGTCLCEGILRLLSAEAGAACEGDASDLGDFQHWAGYWSALLQGQLPMRAVSAAESRARAMGSVLPQWYALSWHGGSCPDAEQGGEQSRAARRDTSERLVPPQLTKQLLPSAFPWPSPSFPPTVSLSEKDEKALRVLHEAFCPTRTAMLHYGLSLTGLGPAKSKGGGPPSFHCDCGLCVQEGSGAADGASEAKEVLRLVFRAGKPLVLQRALLVCRAADSSSGGGDLLPVFASVAAVDVVQRLPAHAQIAVTALLLLRRAGLLSSTTSTTRQLVWLFHLLRVAAPSAQTRDVVHAAVSAGLVKQADLRRCLSVTWGELLCVQEAVSLVSAAAALCEGQDGHPALSPSGIVTGADVEAALRCFGFLAPCTSFPFTTLSSTESGAGSCGDGVAPATMYTADLFPCAEEEGEREPFVSEALVRKALGNAFSLLKSETEAWVRCKTFLESAEPAA